jgi:hypothetical protein
MDEPTFQKVKNVLFELGTVDHNGIDFAQLQAVPEALLCFKRYVAWLQKLGLTRMGKTNSAGHFGAKISHHLMHMKVVLALEGGCREFGPYPLQRVCTTNVSH